MLPELTVAQAAVLALLGALCGHGGGRSRVWAGDFSWFPPSFSSSPMPAPQK